MKEFNVTLNGLWSFGFCIKANSKQDAIEKAIKAMDMESGPIDFKLIEQFAEEEGELLNDFGPEDAAIIEKFYKVILKAKHAKDNQVPNMPH